MALGLIKFLMVTTNIVFWLIGGTLLGLGIWMAVDDNAFQALAIANSAGMNDDMWAAAVYTMIGVGALVFLLGFLGCVGAMKASGPGRNCLLRLYFVLVKLIIIAEIVCVVLIAIFWTSINDEIRDGMQNDVREKYVNETSDDGITTAWNKIQVSWKCCGGVNYRDYIGSKYRDNYPHSVPWTCCVMEKGSKGDSIDDVVNVVICRLEGNLPLTGNPFTNLHSKGCYDGLRDFIDENSIIFIAVLCTFIGLEILGLVFSCMLIKCG